MTDDARVLNLLSEVLDEFPTTASDRLLGAVLDGVRTAPQRRVWLPVSVGGAGPWPGQAVPDRRTGLFYAAVVVGLALILALAMLVVGGALKFDPVKPSGVNGAIAYAVRDLTPAASAPQMHFIHGDGSADRAIGPGRCPTFAASGRAFAYHGPLIDADGRVPYQVQAGDLGGIPAVAVPNVWSPRPGVSPALSPDGTRVAWVVLSQAYQPTEQGNLLVTSVTSGQSRTVAFKPTDPDEFYGPPIWSPDGRSIAFSIFSTTVGSRHSADHQIAIDVVAADGSERHRVASRAGAEQSGISWSADSRYLAYQGLPDPTRIPPLDSGAPLDIFVTAVEGTGERNLTNSDADERNPQWAPDGSRLAYLTTGGEVGAQVTMLPMNRSIPDGSARFGPQADLFSWSPDGAVLLLARTAYAYQPDGSLIVQESWIHSIDANFDRPATSLLTTSSVIDCAPSWQRLPSPAAVAGGLIAYSYQANSSDTSGGRLHLVYSDGSDDHAVDSGACPMFSANGSAFAYTGSVGDASELLVAAADGSSIAPVEGVGAVVRSMFPDSLFGIAPDGKQVAWVKYTKVITTQYPDGSSTERATQAELWVTPIGGGAGTPIVPASGDPNLSADDPVWSPDGLSVAFIVTTASTEFTPGQADILGTSLYVVDADGSNLRRVTARAGIDSVSWSPDGRYFTYLAFAGPPVDALSELPAHDVFTIGVDGSGERNVTQTPAEEQAPSWSPDGSRLAYLTLGEGGSSTVATVAWSSTGPAATPLRGLETWFYAWSPDSARLLLVRSTRPPSGSHDSGETALLTVDRDFRTTPTTIVDTIDGAIFCAPSWQRP